MQVAHVEEVGEVVEVGEVLHLLQVAEVPQRLRVPRQHLLRVRADGVTVVIEMRVLHEAA